LIDETAKKEFCLIQRAGDFIFMIPWKENDKKELFWLILSTNYSSHYLI